MENEYTEANEEFLYRPAVAKLIGVGVQSVYPLMRDDPSFPRPVRLGKRLVWSKDDVVAWKRARVGIVKAENAKRLEQAFAPKKGKR